MPSDYDRIRQDNIREYGQGKRHLSYFGRLYTDRTHFLFELLQNAEDAKASRIFFKVFDDRLEVMHDGRAFNEADVRGLCGVGEGTKSEDLTQIGKFGIGFKSVYAYTSTPEIHSGKESFTIKDYVRPHGVVPKELCKPWTTLFVFRFDANVVDRETARREIAARLRNLGARALLFLRRIQVIEYMLPHLPIGVFERKEHSRGFGKHVKITENNNDSQKEENWLIFERPVSVLDSNCEVKVELAFQLQSMQNNQPGVIKGINDSPLFVYFPTEKPTRLGFLIQGPYRTTPSREDIPKDDKWNLSLIEETSSLVVEVLKALRQIGLLTVSLLEALPIRMGDFPKKSMFYPIAEAVRKAFLSEALLPGDDGAFVSARAAKLARGADLRSLLNPAQLSLLFGASYEIKWLEGSITQDRTPDLRKYLIDELGIEEITPENFARKLNHEFLAIQPDGWFIEFYRYLSSQEALWRCPRSSGDKGGLLRNTHILRLEDNSLIAPFQPDGTTPTAFLPPPDQTDFPIVKRSIAGDEIAKNFLISLGLSEPIIFDEIVESVLPKYSKGNLPISDSEHAMYLQKILRALNSRSEDIKKWEMVVEAAKQTPFLRAFEPIKGVYGFKMPKDIYRKSPAILRYFAAKTDVWYLSEEMLSSDEYINILNVLGVESKPRFRKIEADIPPQKKEQLRKNIGHTKDLESVDYDLDGLSNFLYNFPNDYDEGKELSLILWEFLVVHLKANSTYEFYEGSYRWLRYTERSARFDAKWMKRLLRYPWLPNADSRSFYKPEETALNDLPDVFERNEKLAELLGLKKENVQLLARLRIPRQAVH